MEFRSALAFDRGTLFDMLCRSYAGLLEIKPAYAEEYKAQWRRFDDDIFDYPDSIGACVLVSVWYEQPIGLVSWDPRGLPEQGRIGQNCIVPSARGRGYGKQQIQKALAILQAQRAQTVRVMTDKHPFFIPAQRMYQACGFQEVDRHHRQDLGGIEVIDYEIQLTSVS